MEANLTWSMDFVADGLADGRRVRCLNIVDDRTCECLAIEVDTSITGLPVTAVLERLADMRGMLLSITLDHGPECEDRVLDAWSCEQNVYLSVHPAGRAQRKRIHRVVQRQIPGRALEPVLVHQYGTGTAYHRGLA